MALIEVNGLSKSFRIPSVRRDTVREHVLDCFRPRPVEQLPVLKSVSFDVHRGEALGVMGRNGSGKSTLLKIVAGIYQPDGGTLIVRAPLTPLLELGVGWNPELDAIDNIFLIASVMGLSLREIRRGIDEILAFAELERFANLQLRHYSSGMASRLAYAVAFKAVREILILDEIFAVGDAGFKARCEARYRELSAAGHTVVLVSHDPTVVSAFCDRALLIEHGDIVMDDKPALVCEEYLRLTRPSTPQGRDGVAAALVDHQAS
jgi:ABC-type polysaccharide/polyol phosphate transport system ATPase subunit